MNSHEKFEVTAKDRYNFNFVGFAKKRCEVYKEVKDAIDFEKGKISMETAALEENLWCMKPRWGLRNLPLLEYDF